MVLWIVSRIVSQAPHFLLETNKQQTNKQKQLTTPTPTAQCAPSGENVTIVTPIVPPSVGAGVSWYGKQYGEYPLNRTASGTYYIPGLTYMCSNYAAPTTTTTPTTTTVTTTSATPAPTCPTCPTLPPCECVPTPVDPNTTCKALGFGYGTTISAAVSGRHSDSLTGFEVSWIPSGVIAAFTANELVGAVITRGADLLAVGGYRLPIPTPIGVVAGSSPYVYVEFCYDVCHCATTGAATSIASPTTRSSVATLTATPTSVTSDTPTSVSVVASTTTVAETSTEATTTMAPATTVSAPTTTVTVMPTQPTTTRSPRPPSNCSLCSFESSAPPMPTGGVHWKWALLTWCLLLVVTQVASVDL